MKLLEHEGKELFRKYGIKTPAHELVGRRTVNVSVPYPLMLKSQVLASDRKAKGGLALIHHARDFTKAKEALLSHAIDGHTPEFLLVEELVMPAEELYVSFSYSTTHRAPVLALNKTGGTGVHDALITPVDVRVGCDGEVGRAALLAAHIDVTDLLVKTISNLWRLFSEEKLLLAEINPLFVLADGRVIAGDAKVIRDDATLEQTERPFISLGGDIAVIASGGGASMLNIDTLMRAGGKPANYVEYSGNPPASVVEVLTIQVLSQPGLRGAWVIGGTANFTDIYETMSGFVSGLRKVSPKPSYPIVIRRDGPRQAEAKAMLEQVAKEEEYDMHVFGPELSMSASARKLLELIKKQ